MQHQNFVGIRYFKPENTEDNWGVASHIRNTLLKELDKFRELVGKPVIVTSGYRPNPTSKHSLGIAADVVVPDWDKPLLDLYFIAERCNFTGIGVYPDWKYDGLITGGLHLDQRVGHGRWIGYRPNGPSTPQSYIKLDSHNIQSIPGIL